MDRPTSLEPLEVCCPGCEGKGCDACEGGWITISRCSQRWVGASVAEFALAVDTARDMRSPLLPGALTEQSHLTIRAARFYRNECRRHENPMDPLLNGDFT